MQYLSFKGVVFYFPSGTKGRDLIGEDALLQEIAKHYYKEESTRYLACILLTNEVMDDNTFLRIHINQEKVNWTQIALEVLNEWAQTSLYFSDSRVLLDAMERSNDDAARYFREALICGKDLFFKSKVIVCAEFISSQKNLPSTLLFLISVTILTTSAFRSFSLRSSCSFPQNFQNLLWTFLWATHTDNRKPGCFQLMLLVSILV